MGFNWAFNGLTELSPLCKNVTYVKQTSFRSWSWKLCKRRWWWWYLHIRCDSNATSESCGGVFTTEFSSNEVFGRVLVLEPRFWDGQRHQHGGLIIFA